MCIFLSHHVIDWDRFVTKCKCHVKACAGVQMYLMVFVNSIMYSNATVCIWEAHCTIE